MASAIFWMGRDLTGTGPWVLAVTMSLPLGKPLAIWWQLTVSQMKTEGPRPTTWAQGGLSFYRITFTDSLAAPSPAIAASQFGSIATDPGLEWRCRQPATPWTAEKEPRVSTEKAGRATETRPCYCRYRRRDDYLLSFHKPATSARADFENLNSGVPGSATTSCQPSPVISVIRFLLRQRSKNWVT